MENKKNKLCFKSDKLRKLRNSLGFTQDDFSKKLNVSPIAYQMWELGKSSPNNQSLEKLIAFFNKMKSKYPLQYEKMVSETGTDSVENFYEVKEVLVESKNDRCFNGKLLKDLRCDLNLTQEQFGRIFKHENGKQGVFYGTVSKWERGERIPKDAYVEQMAIIFDVEKDKFYRREI